MSSYKNENQNKDVAFQKGFPNFWFRDCVRTKANLSHILCDFFNLPRDPIFLHLAQKVFCERPWFVITKKVCTAPEL